LDGAENLQFGIAEILDISWGGHCPPDLSQYHSF